MINSRRRKWTGHVAEMKTREMSEEIWGESWEEGNRWEDQD
jgi:hypothetical protein